MTPRRTPDPDAPLPTNSPPAVREDPVALARARACLEAWMTSTGARPDTGTGSRCLRHLGNPKHRCANPCYRKPLPWILDHPSWWRGPRGEYVLACHRYTVSAVERAELEAIVARTGAELCIDAGGSWYWPGSTTLVTLWGRP